MIESQPVPEGRHRQQNALQGVFEDSALFGRQLQRGLFFSLQRLGTAADQERILVDRIGPQHAANVDGVSIGHHGDWGEIAPKRDGDGRREAGRLDGRNPPPWMLPMAMISPLGPLAMPWRGSPCWPLPPEISPTASLTLIMIGDPPGKFSRFNLIVPSLLSKGVH